MEERFDDPQQAQRGLRRRQFPFFLVLSPGANAQGFPLPGGVFAALRTTGAGARIRHAISRTAPPIKGLLVVPLVA